MSRIIGGALPHIPWEDKPEGCKRPVWRYWGNPIIGREGNRVSNSVFNSAVVPFEGGFAGIFRCDSFSISMDIFVGRSSDGIHWTIEDTPIQFVREDAGSRRQRIGEAAAGMDAGMEEQGKTHGDGTGFVREYHYDPRVCFLEDRYYITWCNGYHGPTIGVAYTFDFKTFVQLENAFLPCNRNGVLFPRKIGGMYLMLSRPSDNGHTPFGDIFISQSRDMEFWGRHHHVMSPVQGDLSAWQSTKVGPGPIPIETDQGWLLIYHGVITTCNGFVYRMGAALLDLEQPWKVLYRTRDYILAPHELYECVGDVPNVVFPCAALADGDTGRIALYYGCADTVTGLAFTTAEELIGFVKEHSL